MEDVGLILLETQLGPTDDLAATIAALGHDMKEAIGSGCGSHLISDLTAEVCWVDGEVDVGVVALCCQHVVQASLEVSEGGTLGDHFVPTGQHDLIPSTQMCKLLGNKSP